MKKCSICGNEFEGFGNNPYPVRIKENGVCCDKCNADYVVPFRVLSIYSSKESAIAKELDTYDAHKLDFILASVGMR